MVLATQTRSNLRARIRCRRLARPVLLKVVVEPPGAELLADILTRTTGTTTAEVEPVCAPRHLRWMHGITRQVNIAGHLVAYASLLVTATQPASPHATDMVRRYVRAGASPRSGRAMVLAASLGVARRPAVCHRRGPRERCCTCAAAPHPGQLRGTADGVTTDDVVADVIARTAEPGQSRRDRLSSCLPADARRGWTSRGKKKKKKKLQLATTRRLAGAITRRASLGAAWQHTRLRRLPGVLPGRRHAASTSTSWPGSTHFALKLYEADEDLVVGSSSTSRRRCRCTASRTRQRHRCPRSSAVALTTGDAMVVSTMPHRSPPRRFTRASGPRRARRPPRRPPDGGDHVAAAAQAALAAPGPPGMTVVVGDLLTPEWRSARSRRCRSGQRRAARRARAGHGGGRTSVA